MILAYIIIFTLIGSIASLVGSFFLLIRRKVTETFSIYLVNFAAGALIAVAFLDIFPESLEYAGGKDIFMPALFGFISFFFAERFVQLFHHHHGHGKNPTTMLVLIGDGVHNFIDGIVIAAGFLTNINLGIATSFAVAVHEVPQEIADMGVLLANGLSKKKALIYNFLSALTAILGALLAFYFSSFIQGNVHIFLSLAGGFFVYIAASDLVPAIHEEYLHNRKFSQTFVFLLGILVVFSFTKLLEG